MGWDTITENNFSWKVVFIQCIDNRSLWDTLHQESEQVYKFLQDSYKKNENIIFLKVDISKKENYNFWNTFKIPSQPWCIIKDSQNIIRYTAFRIHVNVAIPFLDILSQ